MASGTTVTIYNIHFQKYREIFLTLFMTLEVNKEQHGPGVKADEWTVPGTQVSG